MGKQGPCYHCGVSSTPLWRNGPPEKPVLCNACGSRWRTKGSLENYTPLHSRPETDGPEDLKVSRVKAVSLMNKEMQFPKRKFNDDLIVGRITPEYSSVSLKSQDDDTRNRSSSGSAISNSESCGQFGYEDASDLTDPAQSIVWETMVPSKKRTCFARPKVSSVEKLTRDLYTIYKEQQKSSQFSLSYHDDLIFENDKPMVSVEIGHGSMLIQCPSAIAREEESETSSLSFDNKLLNEAYSPSSPFSMYSHKVARTCQNLETEKLKRDKAQHDIKIMGNYNPQLLCVDLNDVVNFDVFTHFLSHEEQQQLLKHLPSLGYASLPHSLESMFASIQFKENISSFQKLLAEGVLNSSMSGAPVEECRQLKKLPLFNMSKTKRLEQDDSLLKDVNSKGKKEKEKGEVTLGNSTNTKRTWNNSFKFSGSTTSYKIPDKIIMKGNVNKEDKSCDTRFVPKNVLSLKPDSSSQFVDNPYDEDLLFEVPSNSSFPEAELLIQSTSTLGSKASTNNSSKVSYGFV